MMRLIRFHPFLLLLSAILINCTEHLKKSAPSKPHFFDVLELGACNPEVRVTIETRFTECGEWGGHKENVIIAADSSETIFALFELYPFNCDSLSFYYKNGKLKPAVTERTVLTEAKKKAVILYVDKLLEKKISERFTGGTSSSYSITNYDSTLFIMLRSNDSSFAVSYENLKHELFAENTTPKGDGSRQ